MSDLKTVLLGVGTAIQPTTIRTVRYCSPNRLDSGHLMTLLDVHLSLRNPIFRYRNHELVTCPNLSPSSTPSLPTDPLLNTVSENYIRELNLTHNPGS